MSHNLSVLWVDAGGGSTITLIRSVTSGASILSNLLLASNADFLNQWEGFVTVNPSPSPTAAPNQSVLTQASLVFRCADNSQVTLILPAPAAGAFLADGVTIDPTMIASIITAAIGQLVSQSGSPATAYLSGLLTSRRNP